ncbi:hypothetical protein L6X06_RS01085 [Escherichia coli]|uniref:hypothetical protein n=1 Tax=Escherichia coli TaxID=562 RepID=UPI0004D751DA|nr:hypothetical protein [Escherichia coli]EFH6662189.1 hypothetical protein [Escherichia coli]EKG6930210.1 hypothetical protein [Escherichia coli]KEL80182.1 hypothetical protein AC22_4568 [Escherichia coli 5-366-08_S3_C2]HBE6669716.1 hypothetical protein [Escherichia coli]
MPHLDEIRRKLRKQCPTSAGEDGEEYALKWLENSQWEFVYVEQGKTDLSKSLKIYGGKRPDFIIEVDSNTFILLDAKYHSTENCTSFTLTECEIGKYRALKQFLINKNSELTFEVIFMVFPKEKDGKKFVFVSLDEFDKGECVTLASKNATKISLLNRDNLWLDH